MALIHSGFSGLAVPLQPHRLAALSLAIASVFASMAADAASSKSAYAGDVKDVVVTTGSRGQELTVADSPVPIDVVSGEKLMQTGKTNLSEILNDLLPSFNLAAVPGQDASAVVRPASLRGLNADQVLVLVNGKRRHNSAVLNVASRLNNGSAPVDLDLIPLSLIDHIEVLRDGAAAQYGSDAIAGVINIILKSSIEGGNATTTTGRNYGGDGELLQQTLGWSTELGSGGFLDIGLDARYKNRSSNAGKATGAFYLPLADGSPDPRESTVDRQVLFSGGNPQSKSVTLGYNAELPITSSLRLYSFSTLSLRDSNTGFNFRRPNSVNAVLSIYPDGYTPKFRIKENDFQVAVGGKGKLADWNFDLSSTYGRNDAAFYLSTSANASIGPSTKTNFYNGSLIFDQVTTNLDLSRAFAVGMAKPMQVSYGLEHRYERYATKAGEPDSYIDGGYVIPSGPLAGKRPSPGSQGFSGFRAEEAGAASRSNVSAYVDLGLEPLPNWSVGLAGRAERYTDVGDTVSGKLTTRYELSPGFALRGAISNGFRAPSLAQALYASSTTTFIAGQAVDFKVLPVASAAAKALGAEELKPEKSKNFSLGLSFEPTRDFRITADAYQIDITDRIVQTGILRGTAVSAILAASGLNPNQGGQYFTNAVDTHTRGLDIVADYFQDLKSNGVVRWNVGFGWNKTDITRIKDNPAALTSLGAGYELFDRGRRGDLTVATPQTKLITGANWLFGQFDINAHLSRFGSYTEISSTQVNDRTYSAKWITDLDIAYAVTKSFTVAVGAKNLFDVYPDKIGVVSENGAGAYGSLSPFGMNGGFYYARASLNF